MNKKIEAFAKAWKKGLVQNECKRGSLVEGKSALSVSVEGGVVKWWSYDTIIAIEENDVVCLTKYYYSSTTSRRHIPSVRQFYERQGIKPLVIDIPIHRAYA